jgi:hypothetical protein
MTDATEGAMPRGASSFSVQERLVTPPDSAPAKAAAGSPLWRYFHLAILAVIGGLLVFDRIRLCRELLFKFFDEDQNIQWYAARQLLRGHIPEPCFYAQEFNSCVEGFLAAPLIALRLPYHVAVPLVALVLGLLPYLLMAIVAWRRRQILVACLALLVPLILPVRFAIASGIPRGFVPGIALAIIPALLILPRPETGATEAGPAPRPRRLHPLRFFLLGFLALVAFTVNPNCLLLLAPVAVYALLRFFLQWRFWLFTALGLAMAAPYPFYIHRFYHVTHNDYLFHFRNRIDTFSYANFTSLVSRLLPTFFGDLVPSCIPAPHAAQTLLGVAIFVILLLLLRRRIAAAVAALALIAVTLLSFAYSRLPSGDPVAFYPYCRMFLAVPVALLFLLLLNPPRVPAASPSGMVARLRRVAGAVIALVLPAALAVLAGLATYSKHQTFSAEIEQAVSERSAWITVIRVSDAQAIARAVQAAADAHHVSLVLCPNRSFDQRPEYYLPCLTTCETLFPMYERRTWRLHEECLPRYERILVLDDSFADSARWRGYPNARLLARNPPIGILDTKGQSVIRICQTLGVYVRSFDPPANADLLSPIRPLPPLSNARPLPPLSNPRPKPR